MSKDKVLIEPMKYPYAAFGTDPVREIRMPVGPEVSGEPALNIVLTIIPAGGVSEGHTHPDADEYIMFDIPGEAEVDGVVYKVPAGGIIHARKNVKHECRNIHPTRDLTLYCVFTPAFKPYGKYPELIEETKQFLENE